MTDRPRASLTPAQAERLVAILVRKDLALNGRSEDAIRRAAEQHVEQHFDIEEAA